MGNISKNVSFNIKINEHGATYPILYLEDVLEVDIGNIILTYENFVKNLVTIDENNRYSLGWTDKQLHSGGWRFQGPIENFKTTLCTWMEKIFPDHVLPKKSGTCKSIDDLFPSFDMLDVTVVETK